MVDEATKEATYRLFRVGGKLMNDGVEYRGVTSLRSRRPMITLGDSWSLPTLTTGLRAVC
jgi:hypothetical protein